jgi:hypothetical protein
MDRDDGVLAIVLPAEHLLGLAGLDFSAELVEPAREIVGDRLPGLRPLDEDGQIVGTPLQGFGQVAIVFEPAPALQQLLRRGLVLPEVGIRNALLYLGELIGGTCGVKDSSADRKRAWRDPDIGGAARRESK